MPEHSHSSEGLSPEDRAQFGFSSEGSDPVRGVHETSGQENEPGAYDRAVLAERMKDRVDALSAETKEGIQRVTEAYLEISRHDLEFSNSWSKKVENAEHVHQDLADTYTAYKSGNVDEEELVLKIDSCLGALRDLRASMDPDIRVSMHPDEPSGV